LSRHLPLDTGEDRCDIISGTPAVLKDIETELSCAVDVGMEHLADELDAGRLVWVLFLEMHDQPECAILKRGIGGTNNNGVPSDLIRSLSIQ
jgi:hypothetical protein